MSRVTDPPDPPKLAEVIPIRPVDDLTRAMGEGNVPEVPLVVVWKVIDAGKVSSPLRLFVHAVAENGDGFGLNEALELADELRRVHPLETFEVVTYILDADKLEPFSSDALEELYGPMVWDEDDLPPAGPGTEIPF